MTFFDIKVTVSIIKIANCKKCAKTEAHAYRTDWMEFWKNLAGRVQPISHHLKPKLSLRSRLLAIRSNIGF